MAQEVESFSFSPSDRVEAALLVVRTLRPSIWARPPHVPLTRRLLLSARNSPLLFLFPLIHRKAASSQLIRLLSPKAQKPPNTWRFPSSGNVFLRGTQSGGGGGGGGESGGAVSSLLRRSLWRFSIPSVSCEAVWSWPRSWPASAGPGRASSAQSHSWQWSSWRRKHWRCPGYGALWEMKKKKKRNRRRKMSEKTSAVHLVFFFPL